MATTHTTNDRGDREADPGRPSPMGRAEEPTRPGDTPGGDAAGITEDDLEAAAGDTGLVQGGEAPGIDLPSGDTSR
ncbi:MAG: hypothetical protein JO116_03685 [Planctomycetaceae bacterium]|nr:hypothetical protein [Planctomycetaceae bacterium]